MTAINYIQTYSTSAIPLFAKRDSMRTWFFVSDSDTKTIAELIPISIAVRERENSYQSTVNSQQFLVPGSGLLNLSNPQFPT